MSNSGVTLDMEFSQKLQDIMGKGPQPTATHTPTNAANRSDTEVETTQHPIPLTSGGNSRFSVSPVSENKIANSSVVGKCN